MPDELKIPVSAPGARQTRKDLEGVATAEKKIGDEAKGIGEKARHGMGQAERETSVLGRTVGHVTSAVKGMVLSWIGMRGVQAIISAQRQEMQDLEQQSRKTADAMRAVLALSNLQRSGAEEQQAVWQFALASGRPIDQAAGAYYNLLGGTAGMSVERQQGLLQQAAMFAQTDKGADLTGLVSLMSTLGTQQPDLSPRQLGNLASKAIEQAKSTPSEMAQYLPSVLTTAAAGGADVATATGFFTLATRKGGGVAQSGTAVRSALLGLLSPSDQVLAALVKAGFDPKAPLQQRIAWLAANADKLPPEVVAELGGRRGLEAVAAVKQFPQEFTAEVESMRGAIAAPGSLLGGRLQQVFGDEGQRMNEQINQLEILKAKTQSEDKEVKRRELRRKIHEQFLRQRGTTGAGLGWTEWQLALANYFGAELGIEGSQVRIYQNLAEEGFEPADIFSVAYPAYQQQFGDTDPRSDELIERMAAMRQALYSAGARRKQGATYNGGTHFHNTDKADPAGRAQRPVGY